MAIDLDRVAETAIETTLNGRRRRRRGRHVVGTLAAGAAVYAGVRVAQKGLPGPLKLMKAGAKTLGEAREISNAVKDRLFERDDEDYEEPTDGEDEQGWEDEPDEDEPRGGGDWDEEDEDEGDEEEPVDDEEEPVAEEDLDEEDPDEDEEPVEDEQPVAEDEPVDEDESSEEDSDEDDSGEDEIQRLQTGIENGTQRGQAPDLLRALGSSRRRPPVMRSGSGELDPATQPPAPKPAKTKSKTGSK